VAEAKQIIHVAKDPARKAVPITPLRLLAGLCYHYPQYTLAEARKLPYKHVRLLLSEARRQQATDRFYLTQIIAAPHSEDGKEVTRLTELFKEIVDGN
jgi:hypothetical protein